MCYTCGCRRPYDTMGDVRNIVEKFFEEAGQTDAIGKAGVLILHGDLHGMLKAIKELLIDEWSVGVYYREFALSAAVNGELANVTYGNGVLTVTLPLSAQTRPARLTLERVAPTHG